MSSRLDVRVGAQRPRLSHLPPDALTSAGADAVELAASCGLILDDWQAWCLDQLLAERADGSWAASQAALILPRQNGKNAILEALELYAFFVLDEPKILHTAHLAKTAADHMQRMVSLVARNPELDEITHPYFSNGKEALERTDTGARLEFITRGRKTARGGSPQRVVFDEALFLTDEQIQAIVPSMSAQSMNEDGAPQFIYTSSAPLPESTVLHRVRQRGIEGKAKRLFFAEWSCPEGVDPEDRDAWYASNPGLGIRISPEWVEENELTTMSTEAFLVERLGVVLSEGARSAKLPADKWAATAGPDLPQSVPMVALTFDVTKDGAWSSIAWSAGDLSAPYVEVMHHKPGTGWVPHELVAQVVKHKPSVVACNGAGPAGALVGPVLQAFKAAGLSTELVQMDARAYTQACGGFYSDVVEGRLRRPRDQDPLNIAAGDATERLLGDAWVWDRRSAVAPISPLVAVTIARAFLPTASTVYAGGLTLMSDFDDDGEEW